MKGTQAPAEQPVWSAHDSMVTSESKCGLWSMKGFDEEGEQEQHNVSGGYILKSALLGAVMVVTGAV